MRILYVLTISLISQMVVAQTVTDKSTWWVGGTSGFSTSSSSNASSSIITLASTGRYFIKDNLFVGSRLSWQRQEDDGNTVSSLGFGPQAGITFLQGDAISVPYFGVGIQYLNNRQNDGFNFLDRNGYEISFFGGLNIMLKESLALTVEAGYNFQNFDSGVDFNVFALALGITGVLN